METPEIHKGKDINIKIYEFLYGATRFRQNYCETDAEGKQHGLEFIRAITDNLIQVNNWCHGVLHGSSQTWYFDRDKQSPIHHERERANFLQGKRDGLHLQWHPNNQLKERIIFKEGKPDGLFEIWYPNGQLKERRHYVDCKLDGAHEKWYDDGQDKSLKNYIMGRLQ